jgi:hypothetical protein
MLPWPGGFASAQPTMPVSTVQPECSGAGLPFVDEQCGVHGHGARAVPPSGPADTSAFDQREV